MERSGKQWILLGSEGRLGAEIRRLAQSRSLPSPLLLDSSSSPLSEIISKIICPMVIIVLSIPSAPVKERILELCLLREQLVDRKVKKVVILDCSGVVKVAFPKHHLYRFSLIPRKVENFPDDFEKGEEGQDEEIEGWEHELRRWSYPELELVGNPGCMASAVINALKMSGIYGGVISPISVTAIGGKSYAPLGQDGQLRVGRRWLTHPHVAEIEAATGLAVSSFVPIISYGLEGGLLIVVSGQHRGKLKPLQPDPPLKDLGLDVAEVVGTDNFRWRAECDDEGNFTISAAIDNISYVASLAATTLAEYFDEMKIV